MTDWRWRWGLLVLLATAGSARAAAAEAATPLDISDLSPPTFQVFTSSDGLSEEIWSTLGFDAQGFVWAGSASSLARFDGYRWTLWPLPGARSLVRDMLVDGEGVLWASFEREGTARYDGRAWSLLGDGRFSHRFSTSRGADGQISYWATMDIGVAQLRDGQWQPDPGNADLPAGGNIAIARTETLLGGPREWLVRTPGQLWYRTIGEGGRRSPWQPFDATVPVGQYPTDLIATHDRGKEELWLLAYGAGVTRLDPSGVRTWRSATGELPSDAVYSAVATHSSDGERRLWVASRAGLLEFSGDSVRVFDRRHGLPSNALRGIKLQRSPDGIDLLWLATEGGIARAALAPTRWRTVSLLGASENGIFGVMIEPDGAGSERLWVGSAKEGIALLEHGRWRSFRGERGELPAVTVRGMWRLSDADGAPLRLVGFLGGNLARIDDSLAFVPIDVPWAPQANDAPTTALTRGEAASWELWIGNVRSGVYRLAAGRWTRFPAPGREDSWSVYGLAEQVDGSGRSWLWAATSRGLARLDGEAFSLLPPVPGLTDQAFRALVLLPEGERTVLWASSFRHGVVRIDVTDPVQPRVLPAGTIPPPPDPTVYGVLGDSQGRIYVCTNNGVQLLQQSPAGEWEEQVFRRRDGMVHDECNSNSQVIDRQDRYWVGTLAGLSIYDPAIATPSTGSTPKPLRLTSLRLDGHEHALAEGEPLRVPPGTRELRIDFSLLSGQRELESSYRTQLLGYDPSPLEWTRDHGRVFGVLTPGNYTLVVEGRDFGDTPSRPLRLEIEVLPHWWQRTGVQALLGGSALLLAMALIWLYGRGLRARQRMLKRTVAARTQELSEANTRLTELSYLDPLTGVANRRRLMEAIERALERAQRQNLPLGLIVLDVDHFKDYNDRHGHLAGDAALRAVARALESATREQDLVSRFGGEEFACLLLDADIDSVAQIAERMRALVEALPPRALGNDHDTITISAGVVARVPKGNEAAIALLSAADAALYAAKHAGRNCVRRAQAD